jgi:hypothetical protein
MRLNIFWGYLLVNVYFVGFCRDLECKVVNVWITQALPYKFLRCIIGVTAVNVHLRFLYLYQPVLCTMPSLFYLHKAVILATFLFHNKGDAAIQRLALQRHDTCAALVGCSCKMNACWVLGFSTHSHLSIFSCNTC